MSLRPPRSPLPPLPTSFRLSTLLFRPLSSPSFTPATLSRPLCGRPRPLPSSCTRAWRPYHATPSPPSRHIESGASITAIASGVAVAAAAYLFWHLIVPASEEASDEAAEAQSSDDVHPTSANMTIDRQCSGEILPGRPGNMTREQEGKLRDLWAEMSKLCGIPIPADYRPETLNGNGSYPADDGASVAASQTKKKSRFGLRRKDDNDPPEDKHGSNKQFKQAIAEMSHSELREALWEFSKCDDPDANLCRYLRARKWNVHDALVMLVSTIHWRQRVMNLDDEVMVNGEEAAMRSSRGETTGTGGIPKKLADDMLNQLRMGKSYIHGVDKEGRPICYVNVQLHHGGEYSAESLERLTVYMIETARLMLDPPKLETAVLVFDMTGFSLANMDYTPLKFMIKVFEANYPESLGVVLVHKAPWVFQGVWGMIKGWLDPVVASKINFTKGVDDMAQFLDRQNIPKHLGGDEDWTYKYPEPIEGENYKMDDTSGIREKLQAERKQLLDEFEAATMEWVTAAGVNDGAVRARRKAITEKLYLNFWKLDPYVRARTMYDRMGVIRPGGGVSPYSRTAPPPQADTASEARSLPNSNGNGNPPAVSSYAATPAKQPVGMPAANGYQQHLAAPNRYRGKDTDTRSINSVESVYYDAPSHPA